MKSVILNQIQNHARKVKTQHDDFCGEVMTDISAGKIPLTEIGDIPIQYLDKTRLPGVRPENILTSSKVYKPFRYEFGFRVWLRQNQLHWLHTEVPLGEDIQDWNTKLSREEINLITHIFRLFVQNDVLVGNAYVDQYCRIFRPNEIQMGFYSIANTEAIHQVAYSHLLTELGIPDVEYSAFMEYKEMADKYNFTAGFDMNSLIGIAVAMFVFGGLTEGVQLFASFAILFSFSLRNRLKGMGQIVSWSVRDESLHVIYVSRIFRHFIEEFGHLIDQDRLRQAIVDAVLTVVKNEHLFTDLAFELGPIENMTPQQVKDYVCFVADERLEQFGFEKIFNIEKNPFESWIAQMMRGVEHANFFETRSTSYSRSATQGVWEEAFD